MVLEVFEMIGQSAVPELLLPLLPREYSFSGALVQRRNGKQGSVGLQQLLVREDAFRGDVIALLPRATDLPRREQSLAKLDLVRTVKDSFGR